MDLGLYELEWETVGDAGTLRVLDFLLTVHAPSLGRAFVDAVTNESPLPAEAAEALAELRRRAEARAVERLPDRSFARRLLPDLADDPLVAVELDLGREQDLKTFRDFALFSTAAVLFLRDDDQPEIEIYDSGKSFAFFADAALLEDLTGEAGIPPDAVHRVD